VKYFVGGRYVRNRKSLRLEGQSWSCNGQLIEDAKLLLQGFCYWNVRHVMRKANMAAHKLAKGAVQQFLKQIWIEDSLAFIHVIVYAKIVSF
jgi:hypothetical protein